MTRTRSDDYRWIPEAPDNWWESGEYEKITIAEQPTLLIKADESAWHVFASGIPSNRKDRLGAQIRWTLALSGDQTRPAWSARLVRAWLDNRDDLGAMLDSAIPDPTLVDERLSTQLEKVLSKGASTQGGSTRATGQPWIGETGPQNRDEVLRLANDFMQRRKRGVTGVVSVPLYGHIPQLGRTNDDTVLLLYPGGPAELVQTAVPQREDRGAAGDEAGKARRRRCAAILLALAAVVALLVILLRRLVGE